MSAAIAIDLGATSGRYALGELDNGRITFRVVEQRAHQPQLVNGRWVWPIDELLDLCRRGLAFAESNGAASIGIDSWGVDHGFIGPDGALLAPPVCYRDESHLAAFDSLADKRSRLFALTGCQHQPFNTICQLVARRSEDPSLVERAADWMVLPDLLGRLLGGEPFHELTQASTTQLLGLDDRWCDEAFAFAGWPTPKRQPARPGNLGSTLSSGVRLAHVGSHDTASAVCGFGLLGPHDLFLNIGTWTLVGAVIDRPIATPEAEAANCTNERCVDGRVRFLRNIPGFWVVNRVHDELGVRESVPEWLATRHASDWEPVDLLDPVFFNPPSMQEALAERAARVPATASEWAALTFSSMIGAIARQPSDIAALTGRSFNRIRVGGGGSHSRDICEAIANATGLEVVAGPAEVTVLGNLGVQFVAQGALAWRDLPTVLEASVDHTRYAPCA